MSVLVNMYRKLVPEKARYAVLKWRTSGRLNKLKRAILDFYKEKGTTDPEIKEALAFLKRNPLAVFPYEFSKKYDPARIDVLHDEASGLNYVMYDGRKLYFKRSLTPEQIRHAYSFLLCEQDPDSPHRYLTVDFVLPENAVLADVGCAEGIFTLMNIQNLKQAFLFEADKDWIDALELTFKPWKEKVTIINKFVSHKTEGEFVSLDDYFKALKPDLLKIDVDGAEDDLLKGSTKLLYENKLRIALCTYHKQQDAMKFEKLLRDQGYKTTFSKNYMLFYFDADFKPPYFRKALLRASN